MYHRSWLVGIRRLWRAGLGLALMLGLGAAGWAAEWHVDNLAGSDDHPGTAEQPFRTIARALVSLQGGDTLHLTSTSEPYRESIDLNRKRWAGTAEKPTVIDGHGAVLSGLRSIPAPGWEEAGEGVFSRKLDNNAWVMDSQGYWSGFPIVFFDGQPADWVGSRDDLDDFAYLLLKIPARTGEARDPLHNTLYVKLPAETPLDHVQVTTVGAGTNLHIGVDYVTVRRLTSAYAGGDGFSTTRSVGLVFEEVRGCYNMDQGISNHGAEVIVRRSRFDRNAGCGIVDVYPGCKARYEDCVIERDAFRGGVEFYSGDYVMERCLIQGNPRSAVGVHRDAKVELRDCVLIGEAPAIGLNAWSGDRGLLLERCTLFGFGTAVSLGNDLTLRGCAFLKVGTLYNWRQPAPGVRLDLVFEANFHTPAPLTAGGKAYSVAQWADFVQATGLDATSAVGDFAVDSAPLVPLDIGGVRYGATLDLSRLPPAPNGDDGPF